MANELEIINNPTSTPSLVSTGYQRQNTRSLAASNGIDNTYVEAYDATTVRIRQSGAVDVSGTLYAVGAQADFTVSSAGRYFIYLADGSDANHKTPTIGTDAGTFDAELNARYLSTGERVLNWLIVKETVGSTKLTVLRMVDPGKLAAHNEPLLLARVEITSAGTTTWTAPRSQVYTFELQACGGDGGAYVYNVGDLTNSGGGGGGGGYSKLSEFVVAGTVLTLTRAIASAAACSVAGSGFSGISANNGTVGGSESVLGCIGGVGGNGTFKIGCDGAGSSNIGFVDGVGVSAILFARTMGRGGDSFYGHGSNLILTTNDGVGYGSGGGGSVGGDNEEYAVGLGAPGLFLIWG